MQTGYYLAFSVTHAGYAWWTVRAPVDFPRQRGEGKKPTVEKRVIRNT